MIRWRRFWCKSPNFFGVIEDMALVADAAHHRGTMLVAGFTDGVSLGILKPAGALGADFVVGEGQSFGNPLNYGGPYLGILLPGKNSSVGYREDWSAQRWINRAGAVLF